MASTSEGDRHMNPPPDGGGGGGSGGGGEQKTKRKMKTAAQLELLEKTYAVETYPSESLRAELSAELGLTDRQLQMWFCHRRLKDRKVQPPKRQKKDTGGSTTVVNVPVTGVGLDDVMMGERVNEPGSGSGSGSSQYESRKVTVRTPHMPSVSRISVEGPPPMVKRYYESPQVISEMRAVAFVEAQLGEPVREDGPVLGMDFDPLPPGAFGAPIDTPVQQKQVGRSYDGKMYEHHEPKSIKTPPMIPNVDFVPGPSGGKRKHSAGSGHLVHPKPAARGLHEYQFLPEQPSGRPETYERVDPPRLYSPAIDAPSGRVSSLSTGPSYVHAKEQVTPSYAPQGQVQSVSHLSQQGRQGHVYSSASGEYDNVPPNNSFVNIGVDSQIGAHPAVGLENPFLSPDRRASQEEDASRIERKRKNEEARIAKEVEAHEKRIRKELEKQDILRRKREEQMRREMEKHDRERRKEEERLVREKQREEERFQREQRREHERRERFLQKETLRAEKMRQKEELRREKEAARLKAANERATARRIAKESMELIEDERLELMDLAVAKKGLPSILSLDSDTLQNLELFRDMLSTFPPKSVHLKRPFAIQPWSNSEENVGNLLMVWRFLITFADVLELWPFTLDEFVQGLHDYDPRLLGEIHVALLRSIIKDIEDVARTPSIGLGVNQNSAANPGGGHPQIVEGAYSWGFDIRSWQRHLNPLTWPEILRQFALSAGFGPQLKKRSVERAYFRDDNEGHDGEDIISTLRNGVAAENAVAVMQEKGFSQPRRSRHRLTPGTVKFAAFHVLSLEGSKGLTILEVADKIQKSGLRDLTTSKTPEASIAAALSRDGSLFERTAPSTYCVRAAFRKDPADAEAILSAARAKVQVFQNGYSDSEAEKDADAEDVDDVEKDDDSEGDVAEDQELDDVNSNKGTCLPNETKATKSIEWAGNGRIDTLFDESPQNGLVNVGKGFSSYFSEGSKEVNPLGVTVEQSNDVDKCNASSNLEMEDTEIDESNSGEPWVQGLTEGEYCDLSVEERLNALVALIGVAIEGNSIRVILEERLEAANALKKQMWAEAQLDKRRMKEEYAIKLHYSSYTGTKSDPNFPSSAVDGNQSPFILDSKNNDSLSNSAIKQESTLDPLSGQHLLNTLPTERNLAGQESTVGPDYLSQPLAAEKSRSQLKSYIGFKAEEMYVYRSLPLGQDRRRNKYWQFVTSASRNDPGSGRIFFESQSGCWRLIDTEEAFDALVASLDTRGMRESHLHLMLHKIEMAFRESVRRSSLGAGATSPSGSTIGREASQIKSSPDCSAVFDSPGSASCAVSSDAQDRSPSFRIELDRTQTEKNNALKRYQDFQNWMWKECLDPSLLCGLKVGKKRCNVLLLTCDLCHDTYFSEDNHCPICHRPFGSYSNSSFSDHVNQCKEKQKVDFNWKFHGSNSFLPLRTRVLKSQLALVEVSIPPEALQPLWTDDYRKSWGMRLQSSLSAEELLQFLTCLESSIKRDCISSSFETTKELLGNKKPGCAVEDSSFDIRGPVPILPWVPQTTAAVALRLMELDASISYMLHEKVESYKDNEAAEFIKLPSRYTVVAKVEEMEQPEALDQANYLQVENWIDPPSGRSNSSRGRGGRGRGRGRSRGGRLPRGGSGSRSQLGKVNAGSFERIAQVPGRKSRTRGRGGRRRGRRTARSRPEPNKRVVEKDTNLGHFGLRFVPEQNSGPESPRSSGGMDWERAAGRMHVEEVDNRYRDEASGSESDDNGQATGYGYERRTAAYPGMFNGRPEDLTEESDDDGDGDEDSDDEEPVGEDEGDAYEEDEGYMDGNLDGLGNGDEDEEADEDDDGEEEDATSSDYSD